jgi:uncharacterized protein involved in exopolysaccharide biosynthesis
MNARQSDFEMDDGRDEIDLGGVAAALGRRKRLILSVMLGAAAAAAMFVSVVKPRYVAESRILIENQESYFTSAGPEGARTEVGDALDESAINSQIQILTSRDLARRAVQELHLQGNPEFDPAAGGLNLLTRPLVLLGLMRGPADQPVGDRLLTNFIDHLTVMSPSKTRVLQIEFSSRDPDLAARGANAVAELYIDMKSQAKRAEAHQAAEALKPLIASLETKVAEADAKVEAFRAQTGLYESAGQTTVPTQQLGEIATRLAEARAAHSDAQAKANILRDLLKMGRLADVGDIAKSDLVRRISDQRVSVRAQLAAELRTLLPGHPRIKELQGQLGDLDAQLRLAVDKAARSWCKSTIPIRFWRPSSNRLWPTILTTIFSTRSSRGWRSCCQARRLSPKPSTATALRDCTSFSRADLSRPRRPIPISCSTRSMRPMISPSSRRAPATRRRGSRARPISH